MYSNRRFGSDRWRRPLQGSRRKWCSGWSAGLRYWPGSPEMGRQVVRAAVHSSCWSRCAALEMLLSLAERCLVSHPDWNHRQRCRRPRHWICPAGRHTARAAGRCHPHCPSRFPSGLNFHRLKRWRGPGCHRRCNPRPPGSEGCGSAVR